jgi:hypothetical protein
LAGRHDEPGRVGPASGRASAGPMTTNSEEKLETQK